MSEAEMTGEPGKQSIAVAYGMKRKQGVKKFGKGGRVYEEHEHRNSPTDEVGYKNRNKSSDKDHGSRKGPEGYSKYQEQAQNQKGVHTPVSGVTDFPGGKSTSDAGALSTATWNGEPHREIRDHGKELHKRKLAEMQAMPKPKLYAEGGNVTQKNNGRTVMPIKRPSMVPSDAFSTRMRDEEADLEMTDSPAPYDEQPPKSDDEEGPDRQGPRVHPMKMMADGGPVVDPQKAKEFSEGANKGGSLSSMWDGITHPKWAEGGEIGGPEEEIEHAASIAAGIMAKRRLMADGGEVDSSENADEEPNHADEDNFEALKKENYSESEGLGALDSPEDSNEHGDEIEHDHHDMVSAIKAKLKRRMR